MQRAWIDALSVMTCVLMWLSAAGAWAVDGDAVTPMEVEATQPASGWERTEQREPCAAYEPLRRPFFGDTHVHTTYSQDASTQGTRTTPDQAYAFAKGAPLTIQPWREDGSGERTVQLDRPPKILQLLARH